MFICKIYSEEKKSLLESSFQCLKDSFVTVGMIINHHIWAKLRNRLLANAPIIIIKKRRY